MSQNNSPSKNKNNKIVFDYEKQIAYKSGYKYQLVADYSEHIPIQPKQDIETDFITLTTDGHLTVRCGYAWDGVTSAPDLAGFMRASLKHDVLYQLMRMGLLEIIWRKIADSMFTQDSKKDGIWGFVATAAHKALKLFGKNNASHRKLKKIKYAPTVSRND